MEVLEGLGTRGCRGSPGAEARVQAAVRDLLADEGPPGALRLGLPTALLRLRAGRRETIILALRALLRAGNRGWLDRAGLCAYWRYFAKVGAGFPACVQALVAPAPAAGAYPGVHLQVDICAFVESLTLLMFPQVFGAFLCEAGGESEAAEIGAENAPEILSEGLLLACLGAVQMLARRLRFLHWERDPDLAMALHTLLGQIQDQSRWSARPPWPRSAEYSTSKVAEELEAVRMGLLDALKEERAPAPPPGGPLGRLRTGVRGWRPGRGVEAPTKTSTTGAWSEVSGCVEAGMRAATATEILQPLMQGSALVSPARSAPAPLPGLPCVPRGLFVISEEVEAVCPTPTSSSMRAGLQRKVFARVARSRILPMRLGVELDEEEVTSVSSDGGSGSSPLSHSGSSASPGGEMAETSTEMPSEGAEGTPPARSQKRPLLKVTDSNQSTIRGREVVAEDSPGYRTRFFKAFREAENEGKATSRPRLREVRRKALAALDRVDTGLVELSAEMGASRGAEHVGGGTAPARPARLTNSQAAALVGHCIRLQRELARERAGKQTDPKSNTVCTPPAALAALACNADPPPLFAPPMRRNPEGVQRGLGLFKAGVWACVLFATLSNGVGGA